MAGYSGVYGFPDSQDGAERLARLLGIPLAIAEVHRFPDGESLVRCPEPFGRAIVYRSLDRPNDKLIELMLAASVLRRQGAVELCLVAPYMAYMRQDAIFRAGEPISQTVVGAWLGQLFDRVVAVEPHLHRTSDLQDAFPGCQALALTAAPVVVEALRRDGLAGEGGDLVVVGPDEESAPLIEAIARPLGLEWVVGRKIRRGDRDVAVALPETANLVGRRIVVVDDVVSSGETVFAVVRAARAAGAGAASAVAVHALFDPEVARRFAAEAIHPVRSCDGVPHVSNALALAPLLAGVLSE